MSLAIFSTNAHASKAPGEGPAPKGAAAPDAGFSALFAGQSALKQSVRPAGDPAESSDGEGAGQADPAASGIADADLAGLLPESGIALPIPAKGGKGLPPALPASLSEASPVEGKGPVTPDVDSVADTPGSTNEPDRSSASTLIMPAASIAAHQPGPGAGTQVSAAGSSSPVPTPASLPGTGSGGHPGGSEANAGDGQPQGGSRQNDGARPATSHVQLRVVPGASETGAQEALGHAARLAPAASRPLAEPGVAPVAQDAATSGAPFGQASAEQPGAASTNSLHAPKSLLHGADAQDITRIVDRLTAAREAVKPAAVAMAVNHAEFGELSLRFDQLRTGQLSVQLSASNPEAQSALAVAASQQGGAATTADSSAHAQTQQQQGQTSGRGAQAERDAQSSNGQSPRDERPRQGGNTQRHDAPPGHERPRDGVFA